MNEISYITASPFFSNGGGNPINLDSPLRRMHSLIQDGHLSENSPEFIYYLNRISEEMVQSVAPSLGPDPMYILPGKLFYSLNSTTELSDERYCFYVFYILCKLHLQLDDYAGLEYLMTRFEQKFGEYAYYGKLKILLHQHISGDINQAVSIGFNYTQKYPDYPELSKDFAESIAILLENGGDYTGNSTRVPDDSDKLLKLAIEEIDKSLSEENCPSEYYLIKARLETIDGGFDTATEYVSKARSELSRSRLGYTEKRAEIGRVENRIETWRQRDEIEKKTSKLSESVSEIENKVNKTQDTLESVDNDLDTIRQDFQRTFLEFLGFFSAIIAAIVITGQIALDSATTESAGRLMIASYGGLLFAFGGFAAMLAVNKTEQLSRGVVALLGLVISLIMIYPDSVSQILTRL